MPEGILIDYNDGRPAMVITAGLRAPSFVHPFGLVIPVNAVPGQYATCSWLTGYRGAHQSHLHLFLLNLMWPL